MQVSLLLDGNAHAQYVYLYMFLSYSPFLAHLAKGNVSFAITWHPSSVVNFSHFNLLLWNCLAKWT